MTIESVMRELETLGSPKVAAVYRRHGAGDVLFGVRFADLRKLARRIGRNQDLAADLWATGNTDARLLACMVADPSRMDDDELDRWLSDISYYVLVDEFVASVAVKVPRVPERMERWRTSSSDWKGQAGYDLLAHLAMREPSLDDEFFSEHLGIIEREIHDRGNRTRHAMNGALIAIGIRSDELAAAATAAAARIGVVIVDHGETGCVTPAAAPYIERARARMRKRPPSGATA